LFLDIFQMIAREWHAKCSTGWAEPFHFHIEHLEKTIRHPGGRMQKDMHYCGTYAMAIAAGIPKHDAAVIAYAAQFVDDSTRYDSGIHSDGGLLFGITTAHHPHQSLIRLPTDHLSGLEEQRKIWIPFHFFPGGKGNTFHEKILCVKDGDIVQEMLANHLAVCRQKAYALELMGICAHVYADTFSHYGFSGMTSPCNEISVILNWLIWFVQR